MMREILFRGKQKGSTVWVLGFYNEFANPKTGEQEYFIQTVKPDGRIDVIHKVEPETVGQYTGLQDKNGQWIFEGDILEGRDFDAEDGYGVVEWDDGAWEVISEGNWLGTFHENYNGFEFEIIGNIHDNPELLKEEV